MPDLSAAGLVGRALACCASSSGTCRSHQLEPSASDATGREDEQAAHLNEVRAGMEGHRRHGVRVVVGHLHRPVPLAGVPVQQQPQPGSRNFLRRGIAGPEKEAACALQHNAQGMHT